ERGHNSLLCFQCMPPAFVACADCNNPVAIDRKLFKKNFKCGCLEQKAAAAAAAPQQAEQPERIPIPQRTMEAFAGFTVANTGTTTTQGGLHPPPGGGPATPPGGRNRAGQWVAIERAQRTIMGTNDRLLPEG